MLRDNNLDCFIDKFPPERMEISGDITVQEYTDLCTGLLKFYGRAGKSLDYRVGRISSQHAIEKQGALYNVATRAAVRVLPLDKQISTGLDNLKNGFLKLWHDFGETPIILLEDRGETFAYIQGTCANCAGKTANEPICHQTTGMLLEVLEWLTGKKISVKEIECRAMCDEACVWEINKIADE